MNCSRTGSSFSSDRADQLDTEQANVSYWHPSQPFSAFWKETGVLEVYGGAGEVLVPAGKLFAYPITVVPHLGRLFETGSSFDSSIYSKIHNVPREWKIDEDCYTSSQAYLFQKARGSLQGFGWTVPPKRPDKTPFTFGIDMPGAKYLITI
jgi:hypothetical protein